ncbi:MAG: ComF family protein [Candidatus Omnitrophota bacterium]
MYVLTLDSCYVILRYMIKSLIDLLYPPICQVCEEKIESGSSALCENCSKRIEERLPPFCEKCGKELFGEAREHELCLDCKTSKVYLDRARSILHYNEPLKKIIHNLKYKKMTSSLKDLVDIAVAFIRKNNFSSNCDIITSIPMHPARFFKREINLSSLLAKQIAKTINKPYCEGILKKIKLSTPQSYLKREKRIKNIKGSFSIDKTKAHAIIDKNVLLIDDLYTTGSTLNECAKMLKSSGSKKVEALTIARGSNL